MTTAPPIVHLVIPNATLGLPRGPRVLHIHHRSHTKRSSSKAVPQTLSRPQTRTQISRSLDPFDVWSTKGNVFRKPQNRVDKLSIVGRNGPGCQISRSEACLSLEIASKNWAQNLDRKALFRHAIAACPPSPWIAVVLIFSWFEERESDVGVV